MTETTNLHLKKPEFTEPADIRDINSNMDILDSEAGAVRESVTPAIDKDVPESEDWFVLADSSNQFKRVKLLWSKFLLWLKTLFYTKDEVDTTMATKVARYPENVLTKTNPIELPPGHYMVEGTVTKANGYPQDGYYNYSIFVSGEAWSSSTGGHRKIIAIERCGDAFIKAQDAGHGWSDWKHQSNNIPPEVKNFTLLNGVTTVRRSVYYKLQEGIAIATLSITKPNNGLVAGGMHIATLVEGYIPEFQAEGLAVGANVSGAQIIGNVLIGTDGKVTIWLTNPANSLTGIVIYKVKES